MDLAQISQLAVALSAIVAAVTFILSVRKDAATRRQQDIREWQIVVMHRAFVRHTSGWIPFNTLMNTYRSEASAFPGHNVSKSELSDDSLRRVLTEMLKARLIDQKIGDEYRLYTISNSADDFPMEGFGEVMQGAMGVLATQMMAAHEGRPPAAMFSQVDALVTQRTSHELMVYDRAINIVADDPYKYSVSDLVLKLAKELTLDTEVVRSKLLTMVRSNNLRELDGKLHLD